MTETPPAIEQIDRHDYDVVVVGAGGARNGYGLHRTTNHDIPTHP